MADEKLQQLTKDNFQEGIKQGLVLVDFFADWCGPCRMLAPVLEEVANEMKEKVKIAKLDIDHEQAVAAKFEVTSIPTMILFKDGKQVGQLVGVRDAQAIKKFIASEGKST